MSRIRIRMLVAGAVLAVTAAMLGTGGGVLAGTPTSTQNYNNCNLVGEAPANDCCLQLGDVAPDNNCCLQAPGEVAPADNCCYQIDGGVNPATDCCLQPVVAGVAPAGQVCSTASPTATPTPTATVCPDVVSPNVPVDCATPTPTPTPTDPPTATPTSSVAGETATAGNTPPPTSTANPGSTNSTPLVALLISLAFAAIGLTAVAEQRRRIRR